MPLEKLPKISVIINTYNRAHCLENCIKAVLEQNYPNFEVIIVNGPSTDNTKQIINKYPNIKYLDCQEKNLSVSRNIGINKAEGEYIAFIDDDAIPESNNWLEKFAQEFKKDTNIAAVGGPVKSKWTENYEFKNGYTSDYAVQIYRDNDIDKKKLNNKKWTPRIAGGNCAFRKEPLLQTGGFDENYKYYLDETDVCFRLHQKKYKIINIDNPIRHFKEPSEIRGRGLDINWDVIAQSSVYFCLKNSQDGDITKILKSIFLQWHKIREILELFYKRQITLTHAIGDLKKYFIGMIKAFEQYYVNKHTHTHNSFLQVYGRKNLEEVFKTILPIPIARIKWIMPPSSKFKKFILNKELHLNKILPIEYNNSQHKKQTFFAIAQMHRLWISASIANQYIKKHNYKSILDIGAFPFSTDLILRDFYNHKGKIIATINQNVDKELDKKLREKNIITLPTNLDKFVQVDNEIKLNQFIKLNDSSIDFLICTHVIEHLYHPIPIFKEMYRVLKPGGSILMTTDNAYLLDALINMLTLNKHIYNPIEETAAFRIDKWRGHNRFYTVSDIKFLLRNIGFKIKDTKFYEIFYNSFSNEYFKKPTKFIPKWRYDILTKIPEYRNELVIIAQK